MKFESLAGRRVSLLCVLLLFCSLIGLLIVAFSAQTACRGESNCSAEGDVTLRHSLSLKVVSTTGPAEERTAAQQATDFADEEHYVLWTLGNYSWLDFVLNWVASVTKSNVTNFFVGCLDDVLLEDLQRRHIPSLKLPANLGTSELKWGSELFKQRGREKISFIKLMLEVGLKPLFSDLDVVWLQNPIPYVRRYEEADMLISLDLLYPNEYSGELEVCPDVLRDSLMGMMNVGLHMVRPGAVPALQMWIEAMNNGSDMEQLAFNKGIRRDMHRLSPNSPYCRAVDDKVVIGFLPPTSFVHGHLFFVQSFAEWEGALEDPGMFAVHATFISGYHTKRHYFREHHLWQVDPPERFKPAGGFLSFELDIPAEMLKAALPPPDIDSRALTTDEARGHIDLMIYQFAQVKVAMQISLALKREMILPQLWCGMEYGWMAHSGRSAGTLPYKLPYKCSAGKIFNIELWTERAMQSLLPTMHELAILDHPAMANVSRLVVQPVAVNETEEQLTGPSEAGRVQALCHRSGRHQNNTCSITLQGPQSGSELRQSLKDFEDIELLHFTDVRAVWKELRDGELDKFHNAAEGLVQPWCCADEGVHFLPSPTSPFLLAPAVK